MDDPEQDLRAIWTAKGVPPERQNEVIRQITAMARREQPEWREWLELRAKERATMVTNGATQRQLDAFDRRTASTKFY